MSVINWTDEQTAKLRTAYNKGDGLDIASLADLTGRTTASIISKLVRCGDYIKKTTKVTTKAKIKKSELAAALVKRGSLSGDYLPQLEKLTTQCLVNLLAAMPEEGEF